MCIRDSCGFGRCSIAVTLPIISAMHIQCCPLPTAIFSDHTGFESFFCEDFTEHMPAYAGEWEKLGLHFDGIATGFLGSARQIDIVKEDVYKRQPASRCRSRRRTIIRPSRKKSRNT